MANPLSNPAGNVALRWVYRAILVDMTDKALYGFRATQRHKEIRVILNGGVSPTLWKTFFPYHVTYHDKIPNVMADQSPGAHTKDSMNRFA